MTDLDGFRPTRLEIDRDMLARNIRTLRAGMPDSTRLMAVVKADGYGHGAAEVARIALENGASWLGVAIPEEGARLRGAGFAAPILVLGGIARESADTVARHGLAQAVFDSGGVAWLEDAARAHGAVVAVHIKIDTGMGRIGVRGETELLHVAKAVLKSPHLRLEGVFTHFATADEDDLTFTRQQAARFDALVAPLKRLCPELLVHAANSAALLRCPELAYDMARAGIAMYVNPLLPGDASAGLGEAMRWVTRAVHVKEIGAGETVSYGRLFTAKGPTRVMTLPVGYADGYHRCIGGQGWALVRGRRAPVIGRVCMDQTMLDVTGIPGTAVGDEVVLLGAQGGERVSVRDIGRWCNMIDYEVVLSPTARVPKVYV